MTTQPPDALLSDDDVYDGNDSDTCLTCDGEGFELVCPDDMCNGQGECIHGSYALCPECKGEGGYVWRTPTPPSAPAAPMEGV